MLPSLNNSAEALTSTSGAVLAGNGAELWDSSNNRFNKTVFNDLTNKLFGTDNPVSYIKTNGAGDYNSYGKNSPNTADRGTHYYVVPATTVNAKVGNATNGMVVKLGGKDWMIASLTLDNNENAIMTLYLADYLDSYKFSSSDANTKANGAYSRSDMRIYLKTNSNWSLYNSSDFGSRFLVQPKNVLYQQTESLYGRPDLPWGGAKFNVINDALGTLSSNWNSSTYTYQPSDTFTNANNETVRYDAWGEDYIWLPSVTETGYSDQFATGSIWKLTKAQLSNSHSTGVYIRSAGRGSGNDIWMIGDDGTCLDTRVPTTPYGVRPALHFNLTAAATAVGTILDDPENVSTTYNGNVQTVKSVYDANSTAYPWYNSEIYEHTDNYINLTYQDSQGATVASVKDAGEYWVQAEITDAWKVAVDAEVDAEKTKWGWTDAQIEEAKKNRSPKFAGNAVTEDGHGETDTVRWFKFTIKPKELEIPTVAEASKTYTGSDIEFAISGYDSAKMSATPPAGFTLSDDGKISFKNANTYTINISIKDNNYCWKGTSSNPDRSAQTINITVAPKDLSVQFKSSTNKFNMAVGEDVTFSVIPTNAATGDTVELILTYLDDGTEKQSTDNTLNASGLSTGTYTLGVKLVDKEGTANSNYVIKNNPTQDFVIGSNKINIESVTWKYAQDGEPTEISGNSVELTYNGKEFRFTLKDTADELKAKGVKIDSYSGNVQTNATNGTVTVKVKLVPYDESFEFSDPTKTEVEFSLTVTINKIELKLSDFVWSAEPSNELEYTGNTQTVTIVKGLPSFLQVVYHGNSGLVVGPYTTTILSITVKNDAESVEMAKNYTSFEPEDYADYEYKWQITKKKIVANWTNEEHITTNGKKVSIPKVSGVEDGILEYSYTKYPSGEAVTLAEILASYSETEICVYNVTVKIADDKTDSYMLLNSKNEVKDEVTQRFSVGDDKKAVTVSLQETKVYFNNQPQAVKLNYTGEGIILGDFAVEYKLLNADGSEGEATNIAPSAVGKYKVTITLQGEKANTHIIVGENVFEYVIAHKDRFILTAEAAASHPYKFLYEDFHEYEQDIKEYLYNAENAESVVYIAHLAFEDTLADLLKQFANAEDITAWGTDGTLIEDLTTMLATGMMLRMMDGETVLNQLTISVMGDIDGDGDIGTADKARLNSYTLGNLELKGANLLACDLDGDGEVGTADKARLNAYTLGNLDIYVGLTLRAKAKATSEAVSVCDELVVSACDEPAVAELTFIEESETTYVLSAAITECVAPIDDCESTEYVSFVGDCEITSDIAMAGNAILLPNNEMVSADTAITEIKHTIDFATSIYADRKQKVQFIY